MPPPFSGGCQCGAVRYELTAEPLTVVACHCSECQRQSASAFGISMLVPADAFKVTQGETRKWSRTADSGREIVGNFCGTCGTRVFHQLPASPEIVNLKPGTLDDTSWVRPAGHVWTKNAQSWVKIDPDLLNYETQPEDGFAPLIERYAARVAAGSGSA